MNRSIERFHILSSICYEAKQVQSVFSFKIFLKILKFVEAFKCLIRHDMMAILYQNNLETEVKLRNIYLLVFKFVTYTA